MCLTLLAASAGAATIVVPVDEPAIQAGIDAASYGDTVLVLPGYYSEKIDMKNGVALIGSGASVTTVDGSVGGFRTIGCTGVFDENTRVEHFTIVGGATNYWNAGVKCAENSSARIRFNVLVGNNMGILVKENYGQPVIEHNTIVGNFECGILVYCGGSPPPTGVPTIRNNIIASNADCGICRNEDAPTIDSMLDYNDVWDNGQDYGRCSPGVHDITLDPMFCDGDYMLSTLSPCLGAGESGSDIGALGEGCGMSPVEQTSWSRIKALYR